MAQNLNNVDEGTEDDFFDNIADDDYVFVVDKNGALKTLLCPEDETTVASDQILSLMKAFGIDLHATHTLH
jgi:alkyl hydroperoxide reductase subunit AhpC